MIEGPLVRIVVIEAEGSAPREAGAVMKVWADTISGTIGGGQLEFEAIRQAKAMLHANPPNVPLRQKAPDSWMRGWVREVRSYPLGPSLGQCCGGMVRLLFEVMEQQLDQTEGLLVRALVSGEPPVAVTDRKQTGPWPLPVARVLAAMLSGERPAEPVLFKGRKGLPDWFIEPAAERRYPLFLYGAGHVGRAIVKVFADLPFDIAWVDTAADRFLEPLPSHVRVIVAPNPAIIARAAPAHAFHLVLTYSHPLDLSICHELLAENHFRYLGLIGSKTKRARFSKRLRAAGITEAALARLTSPIGLPQLNGKCPAVIAIGVAAELIALTEAAAADVKPLAVISSA